MRAIPSGEGPERFPPKTTGFGGIGEGGSPAAAGTSRWARSGGRRKGGWGRRGPARAQDVAPSATGVHVTTPAGAPLPTAATVATLSCHPQWHDRGYLTRHYSWRDQTGYTV